MVSTPFLSQRLRRVLLGLLVLFLLAWDMWAIVLDRRLKLPDTFVMHTLQLQMALENGFFWAWLENLGPKGPLPPLLAYPLLLLTGKAPLAMRMVTVLAHGGLVLQTYDLGRVIWGRANAGLWAALLLGTCPFIFGISRLSYHDFIIANATVGAMQIMLRCRLDRWRPAFALGVVLGLGLLLKHSFSLYMAGPGIWFVLRRVRGPRNLLYLGVMAAPMAAIAAIWAVPNGLAVWENLSANTSLVDVPITQELGFYLTLPGALPILVLAMLSALVMGGLRRISLWELLLLFTFIPMMWGFHQVTSAARYMIPVLPLWSVLAGGGIAAVQGKLPRQVALVLGLGGALGMLIMVTVLNLRGIEPPPGVVREDFGGIISPERREHDGFARAVKAMGAHGPEVFLIFDSVMSHCEKIGHEVLWTWRGTMVLPIRPPRVKEKLAAGEGVNVLYVRQFPDRPLSDPPPTDMWPPAREGEHGSINDMGRRVSWLARREDRKLVATARDPDGVVFEAYRVGDKK